MDKIYTSLKQSKKLLELGIDVNTADMYYINGDTDNIVIGNWKDEMHDEDDIPCWSLNSLLNIIKNRKDCNKVELYSNYSSKWVLTTTYYDSIWKEKEIIADNPLDAAFEMVVWLKETGKI